MGDVDIFSPFGIRSHSKYIAQFVYVIMIRVCCNTKISICNDVTFFSRVLKPVKLDGIFKKRNLGNVSYF